MCKKAIVVCRNGRIMKFQEEFRSSLAPYTSTYYHTSRYGNLYMLIAEPDVFRPLWIGRLVKQINSQGIERQSIITVENELRAKYVELPLGGVYYFPR